MKDFELGLIVRCLTGEATDVEQESLREWLSEEEADKIDYEEIKRIWIASAGLHRSYSPELEQARTRIQRGVSQTIKFNRWSWAGKAAAVLVVAVGMVWSLGQFAMQKGDRHISMVEVATGSAIDSVTLTDGTKVWLNQGTTLKFPEEFTGTQRTVFLKGEAFFKVAHNQEMPFVVLAEGTPTRVLGTSFNIKTGGSDISVAVRSGKVRFSQGSDTTNFALLEKNEMATFNQASHSIKTSTVGEFEFPFRSSLNFDNTPLNEVVLKLSSYYGTSIELDSSVPDNLSLTTSFEQQSVEEVLQVVCAVLDLHTENTHAGYRLVGEADDKKSKNK